MIRILMVLVIVLFVAVMLHPAFSRWLEKLDGIDRDDLGMFD